MYEPAPSIHDTTPRGARAQSVIESVLVDLPADLAHGELTARVWFHFQNGWEWAQTWIVNGRQTYYRVRPGKERPRNQALTHALACGGHVRWDRPAADLYTR